MARRRAGQARGGELIAFAMAAALLLFVGREALRTPKVTGVHHPKPAVQPGDTATPRAVASVTRSQPTDTQLLYRATPKLQRPDRAELRRRIDVGAAGTYIADMLADRDSLLTRWPDRTADPVRVWVQRISTVPDWNPDLSRVARTAFDEWGVVGAPLRFTFVVDSSRADIRVSFANRMSDGNRLGVTTHRHNQEGWIVSADIVIATHDSSGAVLASSLISAIARHEVGHALGLGHSRDRGTIMYPESQTLTITGPDRATLKLLYTLPPGSVK